MRPTTALLPTSNLHPLKQTSSSAQKQQTSSNQIWLNRYSIELNMNAVQP